MPRDKTLTHIKVMDAARDEFMKYGFEKASMRSIAQRCGMTAAGLYRHCENKEDLFDQLVAPAVQRIEKWREDHVSRYKDVLSKGKAVWQDSWVDMMREAVYPHMDEYYLLIVKSQGSKYGNYLDSMAERSLEEFWSYLPRIRNGHESVPEISRRELQMLVNAYIKALFDPVAHCYSREDALACLETVEAFFLPGWKKLTGL